MVETMDRAYDKVQIDAAQDFPEFRLDTFVKTHLDTKFERQASYPVAVSSFLYLPSKFELGILGEGLRLAIESDE